MVTTSRLDTGALAGRLRLAIVRTSRRLRQQAGTELSPTLSASLATIDTHGPMTPSELAEWERVKRPTATRTISRLEELGLIARTPDPSDGRGCLVSATGDGRALLKRMRTRKTAYLASRIRDLPPEELETLEHAAEILERILEEDRS